MFGEKIDNNITMLQRTIALLRDVILGVTIAITCVIVYFGGDPSHLNVLDWAKLIGAAALIVIGPLIVFVLLQLLIRFMNAFFSMFLPSTPIPRGFFAWFSIKLFRQSKRNHIVVWRTHKNLVQKLLQHYPFAKIIFILDKSYQLNPYIYAVLFLLFSVFVFKRTISDYIP